MRRAAKILMFTLILAVVFAAVVVPGVAADDIQDFIGKEERLAREQREKSCEQSTRSERPPPRSVSSLQNYSIVAHHDTRVEGERLETRFDVAPALHGGATIPRLQPATQSIQPTQEQISATQETTEETEPQPISEFIPPPNTGRDTYFMWSALGGVLLMGGLLMVLRKKPRRYKSI